MSYGSGSDSYQERNNRDINIGESQFEEYLKRIGYTWRRLGFDEKNDPVDQFYNLNSNIRKLPDYIVYSPKGMAVVSVKGSLKFKQEDYLKLDWFEEIYSSPKCPLFYAFSTRFGVAWKTTDQVRQAYEAAKIDEQWPDQKIYRSLIF